MDYLGRTLMIQPFQKTPRLIRKNVHDIPGLAVLGGRDDDHEESHENLDDYLLIDNLLECLAISSSLPAPLRRKVFPIRPDCRIFSSDRLIIRDCRGRTRALLSGHCKCSGI